MGQDLRSWRNDYYESIGVSFEVPNLYLWGFSCVASSGCYIAEIPGTTLHVGRR